MSKSDASGQEYDYLYKGAPPSRLPARATIASALLAA